MPTDEQKKTGAPAAPENTPPVVTDPPAAPEDAPEPTLTLEGATAELARARKEAATYREKLRALEAAEEAAAEAERRKALTAEQRAAEAEAKAEAATKAADERVKAAERLVSLTGKVVDPKAALKLLDPEKHLDDSGAIKFDALLESYPFMAPQAPAGVSLPGSRTTRDAPIAQLQEQLAVAKTRQERIAIQRQIHEAQKG